MGPNEATDQPELFAKIDSLRTKIIAMGQLEMRLRNCIDSLVGPEPTGQAGVDTEATPDPTSIYELLDLMNVRARVLHEGLCDQTDRLTRALGDSGG